MLVYVEMRGNDQVAFAPREIKRAVPVGELGIQVQSIPEFTGIGFRVQVLPVLSLQTSMNLLPDQNTGKIIPREP